MLFVGRDFAGGRTAWGLLAVRVVFGSALFAHGLAKIGAPGAWLDGSLPGVPAIWQWLVCLGELAGGMALFFGFLTPLAALGVLVMMIGAATVVHGAHPYLAEGGGPSKENSLSYGAVALLLFCAGPGHWSLDAILARFLARKNN